MDTGITSIASYLASKIGTGAETIEEATQDWRTTLYNARRTNTMRVVSDLVKRSVPEDEKAQGFFHKLVRRRG